MARRVRGDRRASFRSAGPAPRGCTQAAYIALTLVREFGARTPAVEDLRARFGMSRATAYRWIRAWQASSEGRTTDREAADA